MRIFQVDAFADRWFSGNPAGVCLLWRLAPPSSGGHPPSPGIDADADPQWMQSVAAEMNLSETAFLVPLGGGGGRYGLRWFTPAVEVDLCGHATLASAHVLWEQGEKSDRLVFETRSGALTAVKAGDGLIQLDFPADPVTPVEGPGDEAALGPDGRIGLTKALGTAVVGVHRGRFDLLVEVADADAVRRLAPDVRALASIPARGLIVTAAGDGHDGSDFVSRCFYPAVGIAEDPVTGSAHCTLASFWCARLGRPSLVGWQASRRGGRVGVELSDDRVLLTGRAVTVLRGELL